MSEDTTKVLGNEDPTEDLEAQKAATTNPMLEAILARMNEGFGELHTKFAELNTKVDEGFAELHSKFNDGFAELHTKVDEGFAELHTKIGELHTKVDELNTKVDVGFAKIDARFEVLEKRMYVLERKFDVFSIEAFEIKAKVLDTLNRVDDLERKAS